MSKQPLSPLKPTWAERLLFGLTILLASSAAALIVIFNFLWMDVGISYLNHLELGTQATGFAVIMLIASFAILTLLLSERDLRQSGYRLRFSVFAG